MSAKTLMNPNMNENISPFDLLFRPNATNIGIIGRMHGDNIEITPVKKETKGRISILNLLQFLKEIVAVHIAFNFMNLLSGRV